MADRIVILGGGTGGTLTANRLRASLPDADITVVDGDDRHIYQPGDPQTLQARAKANIFAIGDAAALPVSKAGSVTHFEGEVLVENIRRQLHGDPLDRSYDGHTNRFIETGFHKAMLIDFNYEQEPVPGHFPAGVGLPLLKESRLNHLGKLMFQWFYWHALLPGRDIPGITPDMPTAGKRLEPVND
jgi:sulfide:quinone oxidoreductase